MGRAGNWNALRWRAGRVDWALGRLTARLLALPGLFGGRPSVGVAADPAASTGGSDAIDSRIEELRDLNWQLRDNEARYRDLLDAQQNIISRRDPTGRLTFVNKAYCQVFGVTPADVLATSFEPMVVAEAVSESVPDAQGRPYIQLLRTVAGDRWFELEQHRVPGAGESTDEDFGPLSGATIADAEVQVIGRDVTEERAFKAELAEARDNAEAADRAKSRFLAAMSHEIRTPMNGIIGMTGLLRETALTAEQLTYAGAIDQSARTLMLLIDEILDFSKIEAGKLVLDPAAFALDSCVQGVVELLAPAAHEKGLELAWTIAPDMPSHVYGDEARVRQILLNLIGNAVKFTDRGGVLVSVSVTAETSQELRVAIAIKDTGIGLAPAAVDRLFAEFGQADAPLAERRGGTGLGLAISRRLAHAMGGSIAVISEPQRGATFTAELSLGVVAGAPRLMGADSRATGTGVVLLAFDRLIERRALATSLRAVGVEVREAEEPSCLAQIAAAAASGRPVEVIIADSAGEVEEVAAALADARSQAPEQCVRGILLIDAVARSSVARFRAAGFQSYLVRPVRPSALMAQLGMPTSKDGGQLFASARAGGAAMSHVVGGALDGDIEAGQGDYRILLAEDNAINALLARRMLEAIGCTVVHAADGIAAVDAYKATLDGETPAFDMVLMDIHMPRLDGLQAAAEIRCLAAQRHDAAEGVGQAGADAAGDVATCNPPPIVALTANAFPEDRSRCLDAGLDDYMSKPFEKQELLAVLGRWCHGHEARRRNGGGRARDAMGGTAA